MSVRFIHEMYPLAFPHEEAVARCWWTLPPQTMLPLSNGDAYQLLFAGRSGGSAGPDVRDAVLCSICPRLPLLDQGIRRIIHAQKYAGDVEFHMRSSDWVTHQHHNDPRYNNVILHVVLLCDDSAPTTRQDGRTVPVCSLYDLPGLTWISPLASATQNKTLWPCHHVLQHMSVEERNRLLEHAGLLRFEQKTHAFVEQLHTIALAHDSYDTCLIPALAEGLGYGRDRAFFHAIGLRLLGRRDTLPEPSGRASSPAPLDAIRMRSLHHLIERWRVPGLWQKLRTVLQPSQPSANVNQPLSALRSLFSDTGLSLARTDILIINIILPFAAAVGLLEHNPYLNEQALTLYKTHPGLPSNSVTRMMSAQLQLTTEPTGSCRQQGLHHIYRETCQKKHCEVCIMGRSLNL